MTTKSGTQAQEDLIMRFRDLIMEYQPIEYGRAVNPVDAFFCYRLMLGRLPSADIELPEMFLFGRLTYREYLEYLVQSPEYSHQTMFMPGGHVFMAQLPRFRFWFRTDDREMGCRMAIGQYEPKVVTLLSKLVSPGDVCLDIGAQTGFFTMHLASLVGEHGRVYSFEPLSTSFQLIELNVRENAFGEIVKAYPYACSDREGEQGFMQTAGMLVACDASTVIKSQDAKSIKVIKLDDLIHERVLFAKLDVEGHEPAVLRGMERILRGDRPIVLTEANEYWLRRANTSGAAYLNLLASYGYTLRQVEDGKVIDPAQLAMDELDNWNVLAVPDERDEQLRTVYGMD